jgi:hypothetical protein
MFSFSRLSTTAAVHPPLGELDDATLTTFLIGHRA